MVADRLGVLGAEVVPPPPALIEKLRSGEPAEKAFACKQLAIHGGKAAVPELAKILSDEHELHVVGGLPGNANIKLAITRYHLTSGVDRGESDASDAPEVRVNCLAPGWIRTQWGTSASEYWQERACREPRSRALRRR